MTPTSADNLAGGLARVAAPEWALERAARATRRIGVCLVLCSPQGEVLWHDAEAGEFFSRYAVPAIRDERLGGAELRLRLADPSGRTPAGAWRSALGLILCAAPLWERRRFTGAILLAGVNGESTFGEEAQRACSTLGVDYEWMTAAAGRVGGVEPAYLASAALLAQQALGDAARLGGFEAQIQTLSQQLSNAYEELALIERISGEMRVNRRGVDFFRQVCTDSLAVLGVRAMGVALTSEIYRQDPALYGESPLQAGELVRLADCLDQRMRAFPSPLLVNSTATDTTFGWLKGRADRLIAVPLVRHEHTLGCLFALDKTSGDFDSVDSKLLTSIANESAIYLENARLFADAHDLMMGILHSLTSAVDAKDAYTCGHSDRVALLSRHLARQIGMPEAQVERVYMAGLLHDVGKIGVPESVLQKTGRLTPEEFEQMKKHPQIGARIIADVKQIEDIIPGVLHHHERYDGLGYPHGLAGQDIPLMGRIICLADCLDAMTSNRTYRRALPLEVALNEIRRCAGTQFDPQLAEAFLSISPDQFRSVLREQPRPEGRLADLRGLVRVA